MAKTKKEKEKMAKTKKGKKRKFLVPKGTPLPSSPKHKFISAHLKKTDAEKAEYNLYDKNPRIQSTYLIHIPKQYALYAKPSLRITKRTPKL